MLTRRDRRRRGPAGRRARGVRPRRGRRREQPRRRSRRWPRCNADRRRRGGAAEPVAAGGHRAARTCASGGCWRRPTSPAVTSRRPSRSSKRRTPPRPTISKPRSPSPPATRGSRSSTPPSGCSPRWRRQRPIPQTYLLIGRAYRDAGRLRPRHRRTAAGARDGSARPPRALHLGMVALLSEGVVAGRGRDRRVPAGAKLAPDDPLNNLRLGMALVVARREQEALAPLEIAARVPAPAPEALEYLGRAQLGGRARRGCGRHTAARAEDGAGTVARGRTDRLHPLLLATALRQAGRAAEAETQFARGRSAPRHARAATDRERLATLPGGSRDDAAAGDHRGRCRSEPPASTARRPHSAPALARQTSGLRSRGRSLNLGVLQAQARNVLPAPQPLSNRPPSLEPSMPARAITRSASPISTPAEHAKAAPATRARDRGRTARYARPRGCSRWPRSTPGNEARAAELLADGSAARLRSLARLHLWCRRSSAAVEAPTPERVFSRLLATHGTRRNQRRPRPGARAARGLRHRDEGAAPRAGTEAGRRRGQRHDRRDLSEAGAACRRGAGPARRTRRASRRPGGALHARDRARSRRPAGRRARRAAILLRAGQIDADARYLQGKILLARGDAPRQRSGISRSPMRVAPEDANMRNQLGLAYQKLGKAELARRSSSGVSAAEGPGPEGMGK